MNSRGGLKLLVLLILLSQGVFSQQLKLGKNPSIVAKSAVLELESDNQGLLFTRISDTLLINAMSPPDGMVIYHTLTNQLLLRSQGYWQPLTRNSMLGDYWKLNGNSDGAANTVGNIDNFNLGFITNNIERMRIEAAGNVGIGTGAAVVGNKLEVKATVASATSGLRLNGLGTAAPLAVTAKTLSVNANGDVIVTALPAMTTAWLLAGNNITAPATQFIGTTSAQPLVFRTLNIERMRLFPTVGNGGLAIGAAALDATNPEKLLVDAGVTTSFNVISGKGTINNYLQLNIKNGSAGNTASSDVVATADNGNESVNYIDMGINSSGFSNIALPILNGVNNAYLYASGNDFIIGNGTASKPIRFFTGGYDNVNERMRIDGSGNVGIGNTAPSEALHVTGNFNLSGAFMPGNTAGTAGTFLSSAGTGTAPVWSALDTSSIANFSQKVRSLFSGSAPITYSNGLIGITQASGSTNGYLSNTDWTTFNNKLTTVDTTNIASFYLKVRNEFTGLTPLSITNGQISISQASTSTSGYLSSADWNSFNTKLGSIDTTNIANFYTKVRGEFTGLGPISITNGQIGITQASTSTSGYL
ncbi:MAG TPA: hypothetical protein VK628_04960, partial [Flavitalea sp.]|nr:hypothetical protein [Flavitalea sp.]